MFRSIFTRLGQLPPRHVGWVIIAVSFALRAFLGWRGGQLFWPDESRYIGARQIAQLLHDAQFRAAGDLLFSQADHLLFKLLCLPPALIEVTAHTPAWVASLFFAAASTTVLALVARVARAAGASEAESALALFLAATTCSLFYYARHYFPYDFSLVFLLLALIAGLRTAPGPAQAFRVGLWTSLGFLTYNGYWTLAFAALLLPVLRPFPRVRPMVAAAGAAFAGFVAPMLLAYALGRLCGYDLWALSVKFAGTVNLGDFGQAWRFIPEYFWATEKSLVILWALTLGASLWLGRRPGHRHLLLWPAVSALLYLLLVIPSDLTPRFAVSARHARVMTPFLCLSAAGVLMAIVNPPRFRSTLVGAALALLTLQAAVNFRAPLMQLFPEEFTAEAARHMAAASHHDLGPYVILNNTFLHNAGMPQRGPDHGQVLLRHPQPYEFIPYLFEGYTEEVRARYRTGDISMRLVRLDAGGPPWTGYPGMIALTLRFPANPLGDLPEPLLSTGVPGRADTLFIRYEDDTHFRIGLDHHGEGAVLSERRPLDRSRHHRVLIGLGSLYSPGSDAAGHLYVAWNDEVLLNVAARFHPTRSDQITFGHNFVGSTTAIRQLSAEILALERIPLPSLDQSFPHPPGGLQLHLQFPLLPVLVDAEPLVSSGPPGLGDLLFIRPEGPDHFRIGLDHMSGPLILSEPFKLDRSKRHAFEIALGPLSDVTGDSPADLRERRQLFVRCNDQIVLNRLAIFHPTTAAQIAVGRNAVGSSAALPRLKALCLQLETARPPRWPAPLKTHPGALGLTLRFANHSAYPYNEPLVTTGVTGAGDGLFIRHEDATHYRIGLDHWGHPLILSSLHARDPSAPLNLTIAMGSLFPPTTDPVYQSHPDWLRLHQHLFVATGNTIILNTPARFHPATPDTLTVGFNGIGASTTPEKLSADVIDQRPVSPETIPPANPLPP